MVFMGFSLIPWLPSAGARAEVVHAAAGGFLAKSSVETSSTPQRVYDAIVSQIGAWRNPSHTFSGNSKNLSIDATPGGCFCERRDGRGVHHMTAVYADPGKRLRLSGGLGPLQAMGVAGSTTFDSAHADGKARLDWTYSVGGYSPNGLNALAPVVDPVLLEQTTRLKRFVESGIADPK
jgi:hypothetical protein